jgi:hypothetical protein
MTAQHFYPSFRLACSGRCISSRTLTHVLSAGLGLFLLFGSSVNASLINHWNMEAGAGAQAADSGLSGNAGTLGAAAAWSTTEFAPNGSTASLEFDGTDFSRLAITGYKAPIVGGSNNRTITGWVKSRLVNSGDRNLGIMSYGRNATGQKWNLRVTQDNTTLNPTGQLRVEVNGGYIIGTTVVTDGQWHHVAVVLNGDGTPNVNELLLYVDGNLEAIHNSQATAINTDTSAAGSDLADWRRPQQSRVEWLDRRSAYLR